MPNLDLKNKSFEVPKNLRPLLNNNESMSYSNMNKKMSELNKKKSELNEKDNLTPDDEKVLKWLKNTLKKEITANEAPKRIKMETGASGNKGGGNNFKNTHKKNTNNANPTAVGGIPEVRTMANGRHIVNNTVGYVKEEYDKEMLKMIYLIEYMDNNKKTKLN